MNEGEAAKNIRPRTVSRHLQALQSVHALPGRRAPNVASSVAIPIIINGGRSGSKSVDCCQPVPRSRGYHSCRLVFHMDGKLAGGTAAAAVDRQVQQSD